MRRWVAVISAEMKGRNTRSMKKSTMMAVVGMRKRRIIRWIGSERKNTNRWDHLLHPRFILSLIIHSRVRVGRSQGMGTGAIHLPLVHMEELHPQRLLPRMDRTSKLVYPPQRAVHYLKGDLHPPKQLAVIITLPQTIMVLLLIQVIILRPRICSPERPHRHLPTNSQLPRDQ